MNYFGGSIAEAVAQSKQRHAIIVVFVEGPNESSKQLAALIDADSIRNELESAKYLVIRIQSETESYRQFADVYKLVPLPSIFFIGNNGAPLVIVTEATKTVADLEAVIQSIQPATGSAVSASNNPPATAATAQVGTASAAAAEPSAAPGPATTTTTDPTSPTSSIPVDVRMARARELVERKRQEQEAEKQRLDRERELERRRSGQDLRSFKERQQELDMKQLKEERQRDRLAEQAVRKRVLEQFAQDRAMSAARFANNNSSSAEAAPAAAAAAAAPAPARIYTGDEARIQFRKPDGSVAAHEFRAADQFRVVREYVTVELLAGNRNFSLASSFPRRQLAETDDERTLAELELAPTAVILVTSKDRTLRGEEVAAGPVGSGASSAVRGAAAAVSRVNVWQLAQSAFWMLVAPVLAVWGYLRGLVPGGARGDATTGAQKRENEERVSDNDAAKRRNLRFFQPDALPSSSSSAAAGAAGPSQPGTSTGAYKRVGGGGASNIHRLHETQDSDDDTNTWNGNSTQQQ